MKKQKINIVMPFSGGMDSTVLLHLAATKDEIDNIHCVFFNYGQRHIKELECAEYQINAVIKKYPSKKVSFDIIDASFIKQLCPTSSLTNTDIATPDVRTVRGEAQPVSYVPNRNMIFLSICTGFAESVNASEVWYGATQVDSLAGYWDASPEFLPAINQLISLNRNKKIRIVAPLINCNKKDIVIMGYDLGVEFKHTYTCYSGEEKPDAYSASSSLRLKGFIEASLIDPLEYKQDLSKIWQQYGITKISP